MAFPKITFLSKLGEVSSLTLDFSVPLLVYFSASWNPPCRRFTSHLIDFYNTEKKSNKGLEIIFAGIDDEVKAFDFYTSKMPWLYIPFENRQIVDMLGSKYDLEKIPFLVLIDKNGNLLADNCQDIIEKDPNSAYDYFLQLINKED